ncbi:PHP domain-containing protein [Pantanalinema sp. GBBB05]|uniref:PHP domain-containing protein n=1 Tax=Pantanalinema sp. GBBB05 TaxID=2604139 RepID=UPI001D723EE4|nr:PHP domain-containing protein [Pantanalinema sp. GBBB05]
MAVNLAQAPVSQPAAQDASALWRVFETIDADSCPSLFNFHMHTVCSDGQLHPEVLMEQAIGIGLQGLAITDHHTVEGYQFAQEWLTNWQQQHPDRPTPRLWTGVEINASLLNTEVHILGYAFNPNHWAISPYLQKEAEIGDAHRAVRVIASIHAAGGLAVLAHPVRYRKPPEDLIAEAVRLGIDGVETYYAYDNPRPWRPSPEQTKRVLRLSKIYKLLNTCGTDTHGRTLLQRI